MATQAKQLITEVNLRPEAAASTIGLDQAAIAARAYELWLARGCPNGSPEEDWFRAEQELQDSSSQSSR